MSIEDLLKEVQPQHDGDFLPPAQSPAVQQWQSGAGNVPASYHAQGWVAPMPSRVQGSAGFYGAPQNVQDFLASNFPPGVSSEVDWANQYPDRFAAEMRQAQAYRDQYGPGMNQGYGPTKQNAKAGYLPGDGRKRGYYPGDK